MILMVTTKKALRFHKAFSIYHKIIFSIIGIARQTKAYQTWGQQIPTYIQQFVINPLIGVDPNLVLKLQDYRVAEFKNYHSLVPMAQDSLKPIFELTSQDGVIGGHYQYVDSCRTEFQAIANNLASII